jgi:hypothetical protein
MVSNHDLLHKVIVSNHNSYFKTITLSRNSLFQTMNANYEVMVSDHEFYKIMVGMHIIVYAVE